MDDRGLIAGIVSSASAIIAVFLVVFGAISDNQGLITAGMTLIGGAFGSVMSYYFAKEKIEELKAMLYAGKPKGEDK